MTNLSMQRRKKGLSVRGLARVAGIDPSTVSRIERGQWPSSPTVKRLSRALGVPVKKLFP